MAPDRHTLDELLDCAVTAARTAGAYALRHHRRRREAVRVLAHDVKLKLDIECQERAERVIQKRFPEHLILGEEDTTPGDATEDRSRIRWIIDPIDGTVNFSHGLPLWCCSVAATLAGRTIAGAVFAPELDRCFTASLQDRSRLNGRAVSVSPIRELSRSMVFTGLDKRVDPRLPPFEIFRALSARIQKARIIGSAALDLCHVACGQAEGYFETGIYIWDVAAAGFIVERAGGKAELIGELPGHRLQYVASNGHIHAALKRVLRRKLDLARG